MPKAAAGQQDSCWQQKPGHEGMLQEGAVESEARQGEGKQSREWAESCFSQLTLCHTAASQDNGSPQMKPLLGLDSLTGNTDVSRGSATVTVQHPLSQTLAFTGSRLPCCIKTQEAKAASLPALFSSCHSSQ